MYSSHATRPSTTVQTCTMCVRPEPSGPSTGETGFGLLAGEPTIVAVPHPHRRRAELLQDRPFAAQPAPQRRHLPRAARHAPRGHARGHGSHDGRRGDRDVGPGSQGRPRRHRRTRPRHRRRHLRRCGPRLHRPELHRRTGTRLRRGRGADRGRRVRGARRHRGGRRVDPAGERLDPRHLQGSPRPVRPRHEPPARRHRRIDQGDGASGGPRAAPRRCCPT